MVLVGAANAVTAPAAVILTIGIILDAATDSVPTPPAVCGAGVAVLVYTTNIVAAHGAVI